MRLFAVLAVLGVVTVAGIFWPSQEKKQEPEPKVLATAQQSFAEKLNGELARGGQLLDVRTPEEFTERRAVNATNLPLQQLEAGELPTADKQAPVYVYCRSGNRSAQAAEILKQAGYQNVTDLGGLSSIEAKGIPVQP